MKQAQKRKVGKKGGVQVDIILYNISLHSVVSVTTLLFFFKATNPGAAFIAEAKDFGDIRESNSLGLEQMNGSNLASWITESSRPTLTSSPEIPVFLS